MKKILLSLLLGLLVIMPVGSAMATEQLPDTEDLKIQTFSDIISLLEKLVDWFYAILLVVAAFYLVWGGLDFIFSGGDDEKVKSGRKKIQYALVGVAIAVVANGLMSIVTNLLVD